MLGRFLLGLGYRLLIHKNCTQSVRYFSCFDFLPILELSLQSTHLVKLLAVFHLDFQTHASWMFLTIVLQNLFSKFCILVETNSCQKVIISNTPTNQVEAEDSTTMLLFHSPTFQKSDLSSFGAKEGCCCCLLCFHPMKYFLLPLNKWRKCIVLNADDLWKQKT